MSLHKDRVRDTSTTTGIGALTLSGTAPSTYQSFGTAVPTGTLVTYAIAHQSANEFETGYGTLVTPTTLSRDLVTASSNAGALVNLSAGTKDIFMSLISDEVIDHGEALALMSGYASMS